jgi:hypothetical protein
MEQGRKAGLSRVDGVVSEDPEVKASGSSVFILTIQGNIKKLQQYMNIIYLSIDFFNY